MVEMEEGIATGSATVTPDINENTNVDTDTKRMIGIRSHHKSRITFIHQLIN